MGLSRAQWIADELQGAGMAVNKPVAVIENGCRSNQRVVITELADLAASVLKHGLQSPSLIVVGEVVRLAQQFTNSSVRFCINLPTFVGLNQRLFMNKYKILVVGNGMVNHKLIENLVQHPDAQSYEVVTFAEEPRLAYDRVQLSNISPVPQRRI